MTRSPHWSTRSDPVRTHHSPGLGCSPPSSRSPPGPTTVPRSTPAAELAELADRHGGDVLEAAAAAARGRQCLGTGDVAAAIVELRRAVDTHVRLGLPYDAARCRVDVAKAAVATGDVGTARLELGTARAAFDRLGARADADDAARRLHDLGTTSDAGSDAPVLTGRELDVLRLVAQGHTNRSIAGELFISPHTVARHVGNVLAKLGVHSRAAAVATAAERGWLDTGMIGG